MPAVIDPAARGPRSIGWLAPLSHEGGLYMPLVIAFFAINAIMAINTVLHDSRITYDSADHSAYFATLSQGRLPTPTDSLESFAAPLSYIVPAAVLALAPTHPGWAQKAGQVQNLIYGVLLTWFLIRLCRRAFPEHPSVAVWTLILLGMMAAFERTMVMVRGEPLTALLAVVACERALARGHIVIIGVLTGLMLLAKQWGAFVALPLLLFVLITTTRGRRLVQAATFAVTIVLAAGWFFVPQSLNAGSVLVFSSPLHPIGLNRPAYVFQRLRLTELFTSPVREAFSAPEEELWPILYSDLWGDYHRYWLVTARDVDNGGPLAGEGFTLLDRQVVTNVADMAPYLGRVNAASLLPTVVLIAGTILGGLAIGRWARQSAASIGDQTLALCTAIVLCSGAGYTFMIAWLPELGVKTSYMLHMLPFAAVLGAAALSRLHHISPRLGFALKMAVLAVALHNLPTLFSRYGILGGFTEWH